MKQNHREWLILSLILLLAASLRLTRLDLIEFKFDEATTARSALAIARDGRLPVLGMISSMGPYNPPLMSYVLAFPFALSRDPRLAAGWVALLGVVAVGLTYWIGRTYFGQGVGQLAALLFAASPWAIFHSRKIWAQNLPALTLLFIAGILALVVRRKPWALTGALAAAGGLVSLHLGGLAFFFILAAVMLLFFRHVRPIPLLAGLALLALILSPYLVHDALHGWPNLRAFASLTQRESILDLQGPYFAALATGGYHLEDLAGEQHASFVTTILDLRWLDRLEIALLWAGLASLVMRVGRAAMKDRGRLSPDASSRLVLLCWFGVPVTLLLRHGGPVHPHTLSLLYPVQHLAIALLLADAIEWGRGRWGSRAGQALTVGAAVLVLALVGWQVAFQEALMTFVDTHDTPGGYGAPIKDALAAVNRAEALRSGMNSVELAVLLPGADPRYDGQAAVFDVLLQPGRRLADGRGALVLPAQSTVYLAAPGAEPGIAMLAEIATEVGPTLPVRTGSDAAYRFFVRQPSATTPPHPWEGEPVRWASGVALLGYDWSGEPEPGGRVRWVLYLLVESEPPSGTDFHWFNHLLDDAGDRQGQTDGVGFPASEWCVGDTVAIWFDIDISPEAPPPPYFVRTGMYAYPDIVNISLLDVAGNEGGEFVELGPIGAEP